MKRILLATGVLALLVADASAGPILDRIRARRAAKAQPCQQSQVQPSHPFARPLAAVADVAPAERVRAVWDMYRPGAGCKNGICPAPFGR